MTAVILAFPRPSPIRATCVADDRRGDSLYTRSSPQDVEVAAEMRDFLVTVQHLPVFSPAWCERHLPPIDAAMDLLEADDAEFARRCQLMRDEDGRAIVDDLAGQLQRLGAHIADVADALGLTAARIREAMVAQA